MVKYPGGYGAQKSRGVLTFFCNHCARSRKHGSAKPSLAKDQTKPSHSEDLCITQVTSIQGSQVKGIIHKVKELCCWPAALSPISWTQNPEGQVLMPVLFCLLKQTGYLTSPIWKVISFIDLLSNQLLELVLCAGTIVRFWMIKEINNVLSTLRTLHPMARGRRVSKSKLRQI